MVIGRSRPCCDLCDYTPKECGGVTGTWTVESGTWSQSTSGSPPTQYKTCTTSSGLLMFSPTSGFVSGDRCSAQCNFSFGSMTNGMIAVIFDAIDADNCHRIRITKTGSVLKMALESVTGGAATVLWESPYDFAGKGWLAITEIGAYVLDVSDNVYFPFDGSYTKKGGGKFGLLVDGDGSGVQFQSFQFFGQNTCVSPYFETCSGTYGDFVAKHGLPEQAALDITVSDFTPSSAGWNHRCQPESTYDESWWFPTTIVDREFSSTSLWVPRHASPSWSGVDWVGASDNCTYSYGPEQCFALNPTTGDPQTNLPKSYYDRLGIYVGWRYEDDRYSFPSNPFDYDVGPKLWRLRINKTISNKTVFFDNGNPVQHCWTSDLVSLTDIASGTPISLSYDGHYSLVADPSVPFTATYGPATATFLP